MLLDRLLGGYPPCGLTESGVAVYTAGLCCPFEGPPVCLFFPVLLFFLFNIYIPLFVFILLYYRGKSTNCAPVELEGVDLLGHH